MAAAGLVFDIVKMGVNANKEAKQKHEADELNKNRPKIGKDANAQSNLNLVESELAQGMSAKSEAAYNNMADRQFSASLGAALRGGADVNSVGDLYGAGEEGRAKLAFMQDNLRLNQIRNVIDQSKYVDERNVITPFQVNQNAPWQDKAAALGISRGQQAKKTSDDQNSFVSSIMQLGASNLNSGDKKSTTEENPTFNMGTDATSTGGEGSYGTDNSFENIG